MAIVNSTLLQGASGKIGNMILTTRNGKTHLRMAPERRSNKPLTEAQHRVMSRFRMASLYARSVLQNAQLREIYEPAVRGRRGIYQLAMRDAFQSPVVKLIDTAKYHGLHGDEIYIHAVDDFMVKSVLVTVIDEDENVLEQGEAVQQISGIGWMYEAKVDNPSPAGCIVRVTARDLPGNTGSLEVII